MVKTISIIIGTIIGAGFASGQEIYSFFCVYNENGLIGIILSNILMGIVIYKILKISNKLNATSYSVLLNKCNISKKVCNVIKVMVNIFLLMSFYIMVAGFSAYFEQEFNLPKLITMILILIICYFTFMKNIEGIAKISSVIMPILICIIIIVGIKTNILETILNFNMANIKISANWIIKSIEYASYNSILLIPILISISKYNKNKEKQTSIIVTLIMLILSLIIFFIMFKQEEIAKMELPLIYISSKLGNIFKIFYGIVIIFAIYSTMISAGYGVLQNFTSSKKTYKKFTIIICISAVLTIFFEFSYLVKLTYPIFGILGFIQLLFLKNNNIHADN